MNVLDGFGVERASSSSMAIWLGITVLAVGIFVATVSMRGNEG